MGCCREGKDEVVTHKMTTEVYMSTKCNMSEAALSKILEAIETEPSKRTPSFGKQDLEIPHCQGTKLEVGLYDFPGGI